MFDFHNLDVYKRSKELSRRTLRFLRTNKQIDPYLRDQLKRACISVVINIAEGSGKFSKADKRNYYTTARASVYECVSLLELILQEDQIGEDLYHELYLELEIISKMLFRLIESQK